MRIARTPPFLKANPDSVEASPWRIIQGEEDRFVGDALPQWDPGTDLKLLREVDVDATRIRSECGLPEDCALRVSTSWHCEGTTLRGRGGLATIRDAGREVTLEMELEGRNLSGKLVLRTAVVLARRLDPAPLRARRPGSVLWEDEQEVLLEGEGSRFPTEVVSFKQSDNSYPSNAAWVLDWDREDLELPVLGGLRLYLNSDHPQVARMLENPRDPSSLVFLSAVHHDVGRQLIRGAVLVDEFVEREGYPKNSIGHVIQRLIKVRFRGESPLVLRNRLQQNPENFDALLQDRLHAFGGD